MDKDKFKVKLEDIIHTLQEMKKVKFIDDAHKFCIGEAILILEEIEDELTIDD